MSRKDYELLARVFSGVNPDNYTSTVEVRAALLHDLALAFKAENNSFNIVTFMRACSPSAAARRCKRHSDAEQNT